MKKIYFRNTKNWADIKAVLFSKDEGRTESFWLTEKDSQGDFVLNFDNSIFDHLLFSSSNGEQTGKIYPGGVSLGVEYKYNDKLGRDLTYLFGKSAAHTGKVENYVIKDAINLSYREDKSKKISVFLPYSYDGKTPHDILYFFDAQNLFCCAGEYTENGDPYGSWQLDIVLNEIFNQYGKRIIVVGIDNADIYRSRELFMDPESFGELTDFSKTPDDEFAHGYLEKLSAFMTGTLHSFIKEKYCVKEENIGIGGASMGGIAAFYCGIREMGFYKYVLSYSPAFALYDMEAFENYFKTKSFGENKDNLPLIHIYCGGGDDLEKMLLPSSVKMKSLLVKQGYEKEKILETYDIEKPHNEESWRLILPESFTYLIGL